MVFDFTRTFDTSAAPLDIRKAHQAAVDYLVDRIDGVAEKVLGQKPTEVQHVCEYPIKTTDGYGGFIDIAVFTDVGTVVVEVKAGYDRGMMLVGK